MKVEELIKKLQGYGDLEIYISSDEDNHLMKAEGLKIAPKFILIEGVVM